MDLKEKCEKYVLSYLENYKPYKGKWCYEDGCLLQGALLLYKVTLEERYLNFIENYLKIFIGNDGEIKGYQKEEYNIDNINAGKVLFDIYKITKEEKYKKALDKLYEQILTHPRVEEGNFWHKKRHQKNRCLLN